MAKRFYKLFSPKDHYGKGCHQSQGQGIVFVKGKLCLTNLSASMMKQLA